MQEQGYKDQLLKQDEYMLGMTCERKENYQRYLADQAQSKEEEQARAGTLREHTAKVPLHLSTIHAIPTPQVGAFCTLHTASFTPLEQEQRFIAPRTKEMEEVK
jgi:hypothetical protein